MCVFVILKHSKNSVITKIRSGSLFFFPVTVSEAGPSTAELLCTRTLTILAELGVIFSHSGCQALLNKSEEPKEVNNKAKAVSAWRVDGERRLLGLMTISDRLFADVSHFTDFQHSNVGWTISLHSPQNWIIIFNQNNSVALSSWPVLNQDFSQCGAAWLPPSSRPSSPSFVALCYGDLIRPFFTSIINRVPVFKGKKKSLPPPVSLNSVTTACWFQIVKWSKQAWCHEQDQPADSAHRPEGFRRKWN